MSAGRELLENVARRHIDKWIAQVVARALPENAPAVLIAQLNERASAAAFLAMMHHIDAAAAQLDADGEMDEKDAVRALLLHMNKTLRHTTAAVH
ncbi:hypothetical protein CBW22_16210 [Pantoea sp. VS1]|uniref:hypothetical protein n=1 Tax=Pantoea sp. VS1 TaxID=2003658 RepID=UPI000B50730B|nr:hypothetical protein [Pantoea sp. VS1]OWS74695.1 hypothetical protein CBW22_16210 [Pantoea sp. VS1]